MDKPTRICLLIAFSVAVSVVSAYSQEVGDLDNYRWRVEGSFWFTHPYGHFGAQGTDNYFDVNRDFGLSNYSTFTASIDWRFRRKHHLLFGANPSDSSRTVTIQREIEFEGEIYPVDARVNVDIRSLIFIPGYQYDILRRDHGFLGVEVDCNLISTDGSLSAVVNGQEARGKKSFFAPLPTVGPTFRLYPLHSSDRLAFDGSVRGMYFFGYGDYLTARGAVSIGLANHLKFRAGYELGSRLSIHGTSDEIAIRLTHRGPTAGIEYSWGEIPAKKIKR
jgi:hypothetical protein